MNDGTDITVIACGSCVFEAMQAARMAEADGGIKVRVINMHTIKPVDEEAVMSAIMDTRRIITVEDHEVMGGLVLPLLRLLLNPVRHVRLKCLVIRMLFQQSVCRKICLLWLKLMQTALPKRFRK